MRGDRGAVRESKWESVDRSGLGGVRGRTHLPPATVAGPDDCQTRSRKKGLKSSTLLIVSLSVTLLMVEFTPMSLGVTLMVREAPAVLSEPEALPMWR